MKLFQQCRPRLLSRNNHDFSVYEGFEIIELVSAKIMAFWVTTTYNLASWYHHPANWYNHFGSTQCLHLAMSKIIHSLEILKLRQIFSEFAWE
jgi:hypothetical protein